MTKNEVLNLLNELKTISAKNETLLVGLQKLKEGSSERAEAVAEIEELNIKQGEIMASFLSLCDRKELVDKFEKVSEEKTELFKKFLAAKTEEELLKSQEDITAILDIWIEGFQNIVSHILSEKNN